jgi:hypothetical protein
MTQETLDEMKRVLKFLRYFSIDELSSAAIELRVDPLEAEEPKDEEVQEWIRELAVALISSEGAGLVVLELTKLKPQLLTKLPASLLSARADALSKTSKGTLTFIQSQLPLEHCSIHVSVT